MPRMSKTRKNEAREGYTYLAFRNEMIKAADPIVIEEGRRIGIESPKDLFENVVGEMILRWKNNKHDFKEAREYAHQHWKDGRFNKQQGKTKADIVKDLLEDKK